MEKITKKLDRLASDLEAKGLVQEAKMIDVISNTIEATKSPSSVTPEKILNHWVEQIRRNLPHFVGIVQDDCLDFILEQIEKKIETIKNSSDEKMYAFFNKKISTDVFPEMTKDLKKYADVFQNLLKSNLENYSLTVESKPSMGPFSAFLMDGETADSIQKYPPMVKLLEEASKRVTEGVLAQLDRNKGKIRTENLKCVMDFEVIDSSLIPKTALYVSGKVHFEQIFVDAIKRKGYEIRRNYI